MRKKTWGGKKLFSVIALVAILIVPVVSSVENTSIENREINEEPNEGAVATVSYFCNINIEGTGTLGWTGPFMSWTSNGDVSITGWIGSDYITSEPSIGFLILFRGTATEDPFCIQGFALISYAAPK